MKEVDEIEELQMSLLLAHYAHMNPEKADNWSCISNAVKIIIDLGLNHQSSHVLDQRNSQQRRQLFWVAYGMERSLCALLKLPLSFPEESVSIEVSIMYILLQDAEL